MEFKPATREAVQPLIALYGESNSGKTYSALLLARGLAGPDGKIALIDTETGRGALYADQIPGGYLRGDLNPQFTPDAYGAALDAAEKAGAAVAVVDSFSHEWEGDGGVCDMAGDIEHRTGKTGLHCWKEPKTAHQRLILRLMRSRIPVICCLRAKFKTKNQKQVDEKTGRVKQVPVKDDFMTPIQSDGFVFEATIILEMQSGQPGHYILKKWSVPQIAACFPGAGPDKISESKVSIAHGAALRAWSAGSPAPASGPTAQPPAGDSLRTAKKVLWDSHKIHFNSDAKAFEKFLVAQGMMPEGKTLSTVELEDVFAIDTALKNHFSQA